MGMIDKICWKNWDFNFKKEFDDASLFFKNMRYGYGSTVFSLPDESLFKNYWTLRCMISVVEEMHHE
jgi:hypothetical protein